MTTHKVKNLTNSPYDLKTADGGKKRLPARGTVTVDLDPKYANLYQSLGYFRFETAETEQVDQSLDDLRSAYKELTGEDADGRWKAKRLEDEINKALEA